MTRIIESGANWVDGHLFEPARRYADRYYRIGRHRAL